MVIMIIYMTQKTNTTLTNLQDGLLEGHPVWAVIYQCLRCGDDDAIATAMHKSRWVALWGG